jgi:glycosyltransferase involved in cell wall biosynthesis
VTTPLVAVCMPAYNAAAWITEAIESVLAQTCTDFELVVSDNASTDDTAAIARSFDDPRVRVSSVARKVSPVENHNRSVRLSSAPYVKFLHADDELLPTCLEEMVGAAQASERVGIVFAPRRVRLEGPDVEWVERFGRSHELFEGLAPVSDGLALFRQLLAARLEHNWVGEPSNVLATRACLREIGLFTPHLFQIADFELWLRSMLRFDVGFVDRELTIYRHHSASVTATNARLGRDWLDRLWLYEGLLANPALPAAERGRVRALRNAALRRALLRSQPRRLARRRFSTDLPRYLAYRLRPPSRRPHLYGRLD